jgi:Ribbon-helix-helix protein, copG family
MRTTRPLRTALPADLVERVEAEARRRGVPVEQLVEQAVLSGLARLWALILEQLAANSGREGP